MTHTYAFLDSCEHQTTEAWSGVIAVNTTAAYVKNGSASYRFNLSNQSSSLWFGDNGKNPYWSHADAYDAWLSCHIYIATLPGANQYFYLGRCMGTILVRWHARLRSDGKVDLGAEGSWDTTSSGAITTGKWYMLSMKFVASSGAGYVIFREMDGTTALTVNRNISDPQVNNGFLFGPYDPSYGDVYMDDIVIESGSAGTDDPYNDLTCNYAVALLKVTGAGGGDWTVTDWSLCDEIPASTGDYDYDAGATWSSWTHYLNFVVENPPGIGPALQSIKAVQPRSLGQASGGNGDTYNYVGLYIAATYYISAAWHEMGGPYWLTRVWMLNPNTSAAWTESGVIGLNFAEVSGVNNTSSSRVNYLHAAYVEVLGPVAPKRGAAGVQVI